MSTRDHGARPRSSASLTDEQLARDWTLSSKDLSEAMLCRGEANRLYFAYQLCHLRRWGAFEDDTTQAPLQVVNHLATQMEVPPVLFLEAPERAATVTQYHDRLRRLLDYRTYDGDVEHQLRSWLSAHRDQVPDAEGLARALHQRLRSWRVIPPGPSVVERLVSSLAAGSEEALFEQMAASLEPGLRRQLDELLEIPEGERFTVFAELKDDPPEAKPAVLLTFLHRLQVATSMDVGAIESVPRPEGFLENRAELARRYDAADLKRFAPAKRHALLACFLLEARRRLYDHVVALHDQFVTGLHRRAKNAFERRYRRGRRRRRRSLETVLDALEALLAARGEEPEVLQTVLERHDVHRLETAVGACRRFQRLEDQGYLDELRNRHSHLKRYLPAFLALPLRAEPGSQPLLGACALALEIHRGDRARLPRGAPQHFVPSRWRAGLLRSDGRPELRLWEIALAFALRDALRAGDIYLPESRHHVSFWNLVYNQQRWQEHRPQAYVELALPSEGDRVLGQLREEIDRAASTLTTGLPDNPFASMEQGRLRLRRPDALAIPAEVRELRQIFETHLPRVRLETLLVDVDRWCGFTRAFEPLVGYRATSPPDQPALLAALVAHGTNLGLATMGQSTDSITVDVLQQVSRWFLRHDTLKAANDTLVNHHHQLPLAAAWGDATLSSSDGQRFALQASSVLGSFYPRYFGYYDRALNVYSHVSDQYTVFASRAISCAPREALYVLDGLLENDSILRPEEHTTDTHGATEQLFGLCFLLGIGFLPRLRDVADQQLYKTAAGVSYGPMLDPLFRGSVDTDLIREQWDPLVRLTASLTHRTAPAHVVLQRLAASSRSDRLAKALTALGRLTKTAYILRYLQDVELRQRIQLQLNRGEARHQLARRIFFANQGAFRTADYEEIMNKVSALALLSNAVLVWNTVHMNRILDQLRDAGETLDPLHIARLSPLLHAHVIPNGTYHFQDAIQGDDRA